MKNSMYHYRAIQQNRYWTEKATQETAGSVLPALPIQTTNRL